jgi:hypothetical protein
MSRVTDLHDEAMDFADQAFIARRKGQHDYAKELTRQAFELETEAARYVADDTSAEPTRSILHRSAASLAIECGLVREAERLIAVALAGNPPAEIAEELRDLLEQVHFERHLAIREMDLAPGELQLSIAGASAGFGIALSQVFVDRVKDMERLIFRMVERMLGREYREHGAAKTSVTEGYQLFIAAPRPGSFAVTLRLGRQMSLPGFDLSTDVLNEVVECFTLLNNGQDEAIRERIPQEAYYQNFIGLAKRIVPDGDDVNVVGLTTTSQGQEIKGVAVTRRQKNISMLRLGGSGDNASEKVTLTIRGQLKYASSVRSNQIKIVDENGKTRTVVVPEGLMNDIVKPYWDTNVEIVVVRQDKGGLLLVDITAITE